MTTIRDALTSFGTALTELEETNLHLKVRGVALDVKAITGRARRVPTYNTHDHVPSRPPSLSPEDVLAAWQVGGARWYAQLNRRDRTAVARAVEDSDVASALAVDDVFVQTILPSLRKSQALAFLKRLLFANHPISPVLWQASAARLREVDVQRHMPWLDLSQFCMSIDAANNHLLEPIRAAILEHGWKNAQAALHLPDHAASGTFALRILDTIVIQNDAQATRILRYPDKGTEVRELTSVRLANQRAAELLVNYAERNPTARLKVAAWLRARIGDVFDSRSKWRWEWNLQLRQKVRSWITGELLDIVFEQIAPSRYRQATQERRLFWRQYTGSVERIWLLLPRMFEDRTEYGPLAELIERAGDDITLQTLQGQSEQAVLWMHLGSSGGIVTIIEGNANTSCRGAPRALTPPKGVVHYTDDIVHGAPIYRSTGHFSFTHVSGWQARLAAQLRSFGVFPTQ